MSGTAKDLVAELREHGDAERAANLSWYFKTAKGEYGEGDKFIGLRVPEIRAITRKYQNLNLEDIDWLCSSKFHEVRFAGIALLVSKFKKTKNPSEQKALFDFYLELLAANRINNWDLVDSSAPYLGDYLVGNNDSEKILNKLGFSRNLWQQRASIMFLASFIRAGQEGIVFRRAGDFLTHPHDLIHKATGWMLREAGKKDIQGLRLFLANNCEKMPRVMLRYTIEKLSATERAKWLGKKNR